MHGHGIHIFNENLLFCRENNVDDCFKHPRTSHLIQPLDDGIFNSYKATYRRSASDSALDINYAEITESIKNKL